MQSPMFSMGQGYYNPSTQFYMDRMRNVANNYNSYANQPQQLQQNIIPCRPVTSAKEAEAAIIDAFSPYIFTNLAGNEIYAKYIQNDGTAKFRIFKEVPEFGIQNTQQTTQINQTEQSNQTEFERINLDEMKKEIEANFKEKFENLNNQIIQLNNEITALKMGDVAYDKSKSNSNAKNGK